MDTVFDVAIDYDRSRLPDSPSVILRKNQTFWHRVNSEKRGALFPRECQLVIRLNQKCKAVLHNIIAQYNIRIYISLNYYLMSESVIG